MDKVQLIAEVQKRPILWDIKSRGGKYTQLRDDMWKEVAALMGPKVTIKDCKYKWTMLRDVYRREVKRIDERIEKDLLNGTYDPKRGYCSKWTYFEHLKFVSTTKIQPRRKRRQDIASSSDETYENDNDFEQVSKSNFMENNTKKLLAEEAERQQHSQTEYSSQNSSDNQKPIGEGGGGGRPCKHSERSSDQRHFVKNYENDEQEFLKYTPLDAVRSDHLVPALDSNYNFLVSFVPLMKRMDEVQSLQFRAQMSQLMFSLISQPPTQ